jgi:hypothetical protein
MADERIDFRIGAQDATRQAFASVSSGLKRIQTEAASVAGDFTKIGGALSLVGVAAALKGTVDRMASLDDAAESTGASVESLSSLLNTLTPSGVTLDQITDAAGKLTRAMAGADEETSKAGDAFRALGIATKDASGNLRPVDDVLTEVAQALDQYADGTNKTAIAQAIFGKSGAELLPILKDLAQAERVAASVTGEQAAAAEELQKSLGRLNVELETLKVQLAGPIVRALSDMIEQLRLGREAADGFWGALWRYGVQYGPDKSPAERVEEVGKKLAELRGKLAAAEQQSEQGVTFGRGSRTAAGKRAEELRKEIAQYERDLKYFGMLVAMEQRGDPALAGAENRGFTPGKGQAPGGFGGGGGKPKTDAKERVSEAERMAEALQREIDKTRELTEEQKLLAQIGRGEIEGLTPALEQRLLKLANQLDLLKAEEKTREALKKLIEETAKAEEIEMRTRAEALASPELKLQIEAWKEYKSLIAGSAEEQRKLKQTVIDIINLQADRPADEGGISADRAEELKRRLLGIKDETDPAISAARELGLTFQSAFEDAIVGGKSFGDVLKGLADDLTRLIIRKSITEPLATMASDAIGPLFGGKRADGGPMSAGMAYLVGERGPELVVPRQSGTVIPAGKFGASVTVVPQVTVTDRMSRAEVYDLVERMKSETASAVLASMQRNGAFARA